MTYFTKYRKYDWQDMSEEAQLQQTANSMGLALSIVKHSETQLSMTKLDDSWAELSVRDCVRNNEALWLLNAAVSLAQDANVYYGDWHSGNVMVHETERPILIDFGDACWLHEAVESSAESTHNELALDQVLSALEMLIQDDLWTGYVAQTATQMLTNVDVSVARRLYSLRTLLQKSEIGNAVARGCHTCTL